MKNKITFNKLKKLLSESLSSINNNYEDILCEVFEVDDISEITEDAYKNIMSAYEDDTLNEHDSTLLERAEDIVINAARDNGYNIIAHHGTTAKFSEFKIGDIGYHLGTLSQAEIAGKSHHCILDDPKSLIYLNTAISLHNPFIIKTDLEDWHPKEIINAAKNALANMSNSYRDHVFDKTGKWPSDEDTDNYIIKYINSPKFKYNTGEHEFDYDSDVDLIDFNKDVDLVSYNCLCFLVKGLKYNISNSYNLSVFHKISHRSDDEIKEILLNKLRSLGHDGIKYLNLYEVKDNKYEYSYIVFDANQIKNCEVVSFNDGKVVPLENRFNSNTNNLFEDN